MGEDKLHDDDASEPQSGTEGPPALRVIGAFGGIRPMAAKLDVPVSTVQGWKARGVIPAARHPDIRTAAGAHGITLDEADLAASAESPDDDATAPPEAGERSGEDPWPTGPSAPWTPPAHGGLQRGGWVPGFFVGALVFAIGAGGAVLTRDLWGPESEAAGGLDARLGALDVRLAKLELRPAPALEGLASAEAVERLTQAVDDLRSGAAEAPARMAELSARLNALETRATAGAEAATAVGGLNSQVEDLEGRVSRSQADLDALASRVEAMKAAQQAALSSALQRANLSLAVGQLRDTLRHSGAYAAALEEVKKLAADDAEVMAVLTPLDDRAAIGVPTVAVLQAGFPDMARQAVAAGYGDTYDGLLGDVLERVSEVISVRPVGKVEGDNAAAVVATAEIHVEAGDLEAAVAELKKLNGGAGEAATAWRGQAEGRLAADAAIAELNRLLSGKLASGG